MAPATRSDPARGLRISLVLASQSIPILIVEDEPLVALEVHSALSAAGASLISAATASEAIRLIGYAEISAALVDVQLGNQSAARACDLLARRQVPLVFYTGRAEKMFLAHWPDVKVLNKPASAEDIIAALVSALHR